ncbi:hypothetical protein INT47_003250 [Mucor saturninus]|uniref:Transposase n=1 Tax=Mucor saturninus TaxID=64648 RepID=A0A8H7RGV3_9FUNG|nr:hypothetical protein INT47_003250 [Mucor saturninus]
MKENGSDEKAIKSAIQSKIYGPCNQISRAVARKEIPAVSILDDQSRKELNSVFSCYPKDYTFQKDSIYYDIAAKPENHFDAFFQLAKLVEAKTGKVFICFPLRTSFIPCYMTLDAKIIHFHILKNESLLQAGKKFKIWGSVVNFEKKAFKNQGVDKTLRFQGTLETDGVGVSIIKQNTDTSRKFFTTSVKRVVDDQEQYIEGLNQADLKPVLKTKTSTVKEKQTLIFTKNNRSKCSRHFRYLRNQNKPLVVQEAETTLSKTESKSTNLEKYIQYIKARSFVNDTLTDYYGNETLKPQEISYFPESEFSFRVDHKCNLYYGNIFISRICGFFPQPQNFSNDRIINPQFYAVYLEMMLSQKHISQRFDDDVKRRIIALGLEINRRPNQSDLNRKTFSTFLEKLQLLPFRKMKFSLKMFYEQNDQKLVQNLKRKFGPDAVLVLGNWSAPNTKFQEPTRNKGLIQMLKKNGLTVYLIDEFKTSSHCPDCGDVLEQFKMISNPRSFRRNTMPIVKCHGLLRCQNTACVTQGRKFWNRDQAAVLNFKHILFNLREVGERPALFSRKNEQTQ